jgi:hypothetical protein
MKKSLLFLTLFTSLLIKEQVPINNPNFTLASNDVTCLCENAAVGESGTLTINNVDKTLTKRSEVQLRALIST